MTLHPIRAVEYQPETSATEVTPAERLTAMVASIGEHLDEVASSLRAAEANLAAARHLHDEILVIIAAL